LTIAWILAAGCSGHSPEPTVEEPELHVNAVTLWSDKTELFMEYPELVRGENSGFAVHLTDLASYRPISEGQAILEFANDRKTARFESSEPSRPGIFRIDVVFEDSGTYRAALLVQTPGIEDRHEFGEVIVHETMDSALARATEESETESIGFLKEQQWASEFATELAVPRMIESSIKLPAVVQVRGGGEGSAVSPIKGRLAPQHTLPVPGQRIRKGELLTKVIPFTASPQDPAGLKLELAQAEMDLAQAQRLRKRLEALLSERAIPARRVEEARTDEDRAEVRIGAAKERLAQFERSRSGTGDEEAVSGAFEVLAPLSGIVTGISALTGGSVEAGREIVHIMDVDRVWVIAQVPEAESMILKNMRKAVLLTGEGTISIPGKRGSIERIGNFVDPESRRIPVIFDVVNADGELRIGQSLFARLGTGTAEDRVSVPVSALVDDAGRPVVFVQLNGESFERRMVQTGAANEEYVQIAQGIREGDRVVNKGAYLIRLAAMSTQIPAHGHVH